MTFWCFQVAKAARTHYNFFLSSLPLSKQLVKSHFDDQREEKSIHKRVLKNYVFIY